MTDFAMTTPAAGLPPFPSTHNGGPPLVETAKAAAGADTQATTELPATVADKPGTKSFKLAVPIADADGNAVDTLTLVEPTLSHHIRAQREAPTDGVERLIAMIAILSGYAPTPAAPLGESPIRRLKARDAAVIKRWLVEIERPAKLGEPPADGETTRTFTLAAPIDGGGATIAAITLREPDLEAGIAIERFTGEAEQTAAMLASLSGLTIPVVSRLKMSDVDVMERWMGFFSQDGEELPPSPQLAQLAALIASLDAIRAGGTLQ